MLQKALAAFGIEKGSYDAEPLGSGLINHTWKITCAKKSFVLQRINQSIFKNPNAIAYNTNLVGTYLHQHYPEYLFILQVRTKDNQLLYVDQEDGSFRFMPFIENSHTIDVVAFPEQAYEAAAAFGRFTRNLNSFDHHSLQITIPDFHNLPLRYQQFQEALKTGNRERMIQSKDIIEFLLHQKRIVETFDQLQATKDFQQRTIHHDTKISNVLFDDNDKALCVIDLDTLMPGYFISDAGDMMRTYLSPVSEEEKDTSKIFIREEYFTAIVQGYLKYMGDVLTKTEINHFVYAGKFMIYMQALRFLTDHLFNDLYYGTSYEEHNLVRAINQAALLERFVQKETFFHQIVTDIVKSYRK